jgi:FkbM family methyltransferase
MPADNLLEELLTKICQEPRASMMERERSTFDQLAGPFKDAVILYGAGPLGKQVVAGLRQAGAPDPLFFADGREALWGQKVDGIEVLSPANAAARYGDSACFVVTIYNGSGVRQRLRTMGCACVTSYAPLLWKYADVFIPSTCMGLAHPMWDSLDEIRQAYAVLADESSRTLFREQLQWRTDLKSEAMLPPSPVAETYFPADIVSASPQEVLVDCGAFDGDSIGSFLKLRGGKFEHIYALEPDPANRAMLENFRQKLPAGDGERFTVLPYAVSNEHKFVNFAGGDLVRSHIAGETGTGDTECVPLDEIFADKNPTYIKMDIEGAEPEAIEGAAGVLNRAQPVLAACVYHRWEHLWEIPSLIRSLTEGHEIFLRRYAEDCWELVCYAVPKSRIAG